MQLILASGSPRRRELLCQIGITDFVVRPADVDETIAPGTAPGDAVAMLSARKAAAVSGLYPDDLVLAADTVVALDDTILGKPRDEADAKAMLRVLSGRTHRVYTGFTLQRGAQIESGVVDTAVTFRALSDAEIDAYVSTGEPMDKAGAYGIQGVGALLVSALEGDYFNVMGLPLCPVGLALKTFGVQTLGEG